MCCTAVRDSALLLLWIAVRLLMPAGGGDEIEAWDNLIQAIRTILIADLVMSVDNVIAVAAAVKGNVLLLVLVLGLAVSDFRRALPDHHYAGRGDPRLGGGRRGGSPPDPY